MDSGILIPLQKKSNVKSFEFLFDIMTYNSDWHQPKPRHVAMIQDLRRIIERNWQVEQDWRQHLPQRMRLSKDETPEHSRTRKYIRGGNNSNTQIRQSQKKRGAEFIE